MRGPGAAPGRRCDGWRSAWGGRRRSVSRARDVAGRVNGGRFPAGQWHRAPRRECRPARRSAGRPPVGFPAPACCRVGPAEAESVDALPLALLLLEAGRQLGVLAQPLPLTAIMVEGDLLALNTCGLNAGLARPVAQQTVIVLAVDQVQVEVGVARLQFPDPLQTRRTIEFDEQLETAGHRTVQGRRSALDG